MCNDPPGAIGVQVGVRGRGYKGRGYKGGEEGCMLQLEVQAPSCVRGLGV